MKSSLERKKIKQEGKKNLIPTKGKNKNWMLYHTQKDTISLKSGVLEIKTIGLHLSCLPFQIQFLTSANEAGLYALYLYGFLPLRFPVGY